MLEMLKYGNATQPLGNFELKMRLVTEMPSVCRKGGAVRCLLYGGVVGLGSFMVRAILDLLMSWV